MNNKINVKFKERIPYKKLHRIHVANNWPEPIPLAALNGGFVLVANTGAMLVKVYLPYE